MEKRSLFDRLGGLSTLEKVSFKIGEKLAHDKKTSEFFQNVDTNKVNQNRRDYLAYLFGGPNDYKGKSLEEAHKKFNLKEEHFQLFSLYAKQAFSELNIDPSLIEEALRMVEPTRREVLSQNPLYERLGGDDFFAKLGDILGKKILEDSLLGPIYSKTDFKRVNELRMQFMKSLFGGKGDYQGKSMKEAHSKQDLNDSHFDRFIYLFKDSMNEMKVKSDLMQEATNLLETLRPQILNKPALFETIGGSEGLERVQNRFYKKVIEDPTLAPLMKDVDPEKLKYGVRHYFMSVLGGPNCYLGKNLREAHSKLKLSDQQFNLYLKLLRKSLLEEGVKEDDTNQFLEALDLTRDQVLNRKSILDRIGGEQALVSIIKEFHQNLRKDQILGPYYQKGDPERMMRNYTHYFSYLFGDGMPHVGQPLFYTHKSMQLTDAHFDLFIDIFAKTLKDFKIEEETICEAVQQLEKRRNEVLQRKSLWARLGGEEFMDKVCHRFEEILMKDPVVGPMHKGIDIQKYHENHMDLFADLFGGYHFYSGKSLKEAHRPLKLSDEHFDLFVKLFQQALKDLGMNQELLQEVREKLEFERNEVLNRRSLYEKMGGEAIVDLLVDKLHSLIANDPVIGPFHKDVDWAKLQLSRKQYFIKLFGNLDVYQGKDLRTAHQGFNLNDKHFDIFAKHFKTAMSQINMKSDLIEQAMMLLEGTRSEVLNGPSIFEKMGGKDGLMKFVKKLDDVSIKDAKLSQFFEKIDRNKLDEHQFQYFSNMFGGPKLNYEGKSMRSAHEHLPLSDEHFKVYLDLTQDVLKDLNVDKSVVEEAIRLFQTKRGEVLNQ